MILNISNEHRQKYFSQKEKGGVVYKITNQIDGKFYIGSTNNLIKRYYTHIHDIRSVRNTCVKLIRAVNKHGEDNFTFEILCECSTEEILKTEQSYIDTLNPTYNIAKIAGSNLGIKRTEEIKLKKSISQKANWKDDDYRNKHLENLSKNWKSGASHRMAKLTEEQVIEIKKQLANGLLPKQVADKLQLSYYSIKDIHRGKSWKNIKI
jgi:group I intron endonuclease